ncbi:MAG: hypothetical protein H7Y13_11785 [Sphingobacteriaceae bacterium]|nr:hypothetical protein [Sphingobacteriaceae bacterium]
MKKPERLTMSFKDAQAIKMYIAMGISNVVFDKITFAARKVIANIDKACEMITAGVNDRIDTARIKHALTDKESGAILFDRSASGENYKYSADGLLALRAEIKKEQDSVQNMMVEFEPCIAEIDQCPRVKTFDPLVIEKLDGILFPKGYFKKTFVDFK